MRSARLPVNLIGSPINDANRLIGCSIASQNTGPVFPQAAAEARDYRAWRRLQELNGQIAALRGQQAAIVTPVTPVERCVRL